MSDFKKKYVIDRIIPNSVIEKKVFIFCILLWCFFTVVDILSKQWIVENIQEQREWITIIPNFFNIVHVRNPGAAFGQLQNSGSLLLGLSIVVFIVLIFTFRKFAEGCSERYVALILVMSGIAGNCSDRIFRTPGTVVDFLDFYIGNSHWPSFNVADSCICVGATLLIVSNLFRKDLSKIQSEKKDEMASSPVN